MGKTVLHDCLYFRVLSRYATARPSLFGSQQGQKHVERHLHTVDKDQTVLGADELKVDGMHQRPDLPRTLASSEQVVLNFVLNHIERITIGQTQISEEDRHEDRAPEQLVNSNLQCNMLGLGSWDLAVEPVVEVMSRRSMVDETKD
jgi:hypothetical protein